jgi:hypothetical protein
MFGLQRGRDITREAMAQVAAERMALVLTESS